MSEWMERDVQSKKMMQLTPERVATLEESRRSGLPVVKKEVEGGSKMIEPLRFQPVRSPDIFEAEFAKKDNDLIFHFWPWGMHEADRIGKPRPAFPLEFIHELRKVMDVMFGKELVDISDDREMGAYSVLVKTYGARQFWRPLSIKAVTQLHLNLGGDPA